jgi:hypothetical protein
MSAWRCVMAATTAEDVHRFDGTFDNAWGVQALAAPSLTPPPPSTADPREESE